MKLEEYIEKRKMNLVTFSKHSNVSYTSLWNLIKLGRDVRGSILIQLEKETQGMCTVQEIYNDYVRDRPKKKLETLE